MNTKIHVSVLSVFGLGITCLAQQMAPPPQASEVMNRIRSSAIRAHIRFLSDGTLEGRGTGTRGHEIAAKYIATELEAMGLEPAGVHGGYFQPVPLQKIELLPNQSSVQFVRDGNARTVVDGQEYVMRGDPLQPEQNVDAPVAFVGFGVTAPELNFDDYATFDVRGKVVAMLYGAPARFASTERAYYSDGSLKAKNAAAHGAIGVLTFLMPEDQRRYAWNWLVPQIRMPGMRWLDYEGMPNDAVPQIHGGALLSQSGAQLLFTGAPKNLEEVFVTARSSQPQALPLPGTVRIHTVSRHTQVSSPNVIAVLRGSDPKLREQYVVYTAHLDHLGTCPPIDGDDVCHGAFDNASGSAAQLEVAHAFASLSQHPRRSILFIFVTGEEKGLLGSDYFAHYPTVAPNNIVADLNIDGAPGLLYPIKDVVPQGAEHSTLAKDVDDAAQQLGIEISPDPMPEEVSFIRSDQYSFVRQGVPSVALFQGFKSNDPKVDGAAITKQWLVTLYHTPKDSISQPFDYESAAKGTRLNFLIGYEVAQQHDRPAWNPHDFFGEKFGKLHTSTAPLK